jgi:hypothetical protein
MAGEVVAGELGYFWSFSYRATTREKAPAELASDWNSKPLSLIAGGIYMLVKILTVQ